MATEIHPPPNTDLGNVAIIGGGVIGCFLAYLLSKEGVPVTVIERKGVASEASGASAGNVQPVTRTYGQFQINMGVESLALFRRFLPEIKSYFGVAFRDQDVTYLYAALDENEVQQTRSFSEEFRNAGLRVEWIDARAARDLDPRLAPEILGGMLHPDCIQMDPYAFVNALSQAAALHGARFVVDEAVGLDTAADRLTGVRLAGGDLVPCDTAVMAMGAWGGLALERWLRISLPIGPHPLEKLHLKLEGPRLGCAVRWMETNMVHRVDGLMHLGSKHNNTGFEARPTEKGKEWLLQRVRKIFPGLKFQVAEATAGCGADTPGRVPILGPVSDVAGVYMAVAATDGFLLSAFIAQVLTDLLVRRHSHPLLPEMSPQRALQRAAELIPEPH